MLEQIRRRVPGVLVMSHRGGGGLWPENTLYGFERSVRMGVDVLEMDVHSTADGVLVVAHDDRVEASTHGAGRIKDLTLAEVKALDAGYRWTADGGASYPYRGQGITIPTLQEVLEAFPDAYLNIDIKQAEPPIVAPFCQMLRRYQRLDQVLVGSFRDEPLKTFRKLCPEAATAAGERETRLFFALSLGALDGVYRPRAEAFQLPEYSGKTHIVTPRLIQAAHAHQMEVHVWTVNEVEAMRRLIEWGVNGIFTDFPDRLLKVLGR